MRGVGWLLRGNCFQDSSGTLAGGVYRPARYSNIAVGLTLRLTGSDVEIDCSGR